MRRTVQIAATAIGLAASAGTASAFDLGALSQFGIQVPDNTAGFLCNAQPSDQFFEQFNCPLVAEAFWTRDYSAVQGYPKAVLAKYTHAFATTLHAPDLTYKVGAQVHAQLDPNLPIHLNIMLASDPDIVSGTIGEELSIGIEVATGFFEALNNMANSNNPNVLDLMTAPASGMANHPKHVLRAIEFGRQDAVVWVAIAEYDPDVAIELYNGLRELAYSM